MLKGDDSIVNCIQPHPNSCYLATSGIDPQVRIWTPRIPDADEISDRKHPKKKSSLLSSTADSEQITANDESSSHDLDDENSRVVRDIRAAEINNHMQMNSHPFEFLFLNFSQSKLLFCGKMYNIKDKISNG